MGSKISRLAKPRFEEELDLLIAESSSITRDVLKSELLDALWVHYSELCRWNQRLSLIGPGTGFEVVRRHYLESLEGLEFLKSSDRRLMDVGSGGGFPGWVIAAACPGLDVSLVEPREKKWVFLQAAIRKAGLLSCKALNARVEIPLSSSLGLPESLDVVTSRALAIPAGTLKEIGDHAPQTRFLFWIGREEIDLPEGFEISREKSLPGSDYRRIVEIKRV